MLELLEKQSRVVNLKSPLARDVFRLAKVVWVMFFSPAQWCPHL